jgi:hypothetical protein
VRSCLVAGGCVAAVLLAVLPAVSTGAHFLQIPYRRVLRDREIHPGARRAVRGTAPRPVGLRERSKQEPLRGGCRGLPWHLSAAAFAGRCWSHFIHRRSRVVPYGLPGYRRLRRAPPQPRGCPGASAGGQRGIWEDSDRRKGIPRVRRGVGSVGAWRFARPIQSHRGYLPVGDAAGLNLSGGPPLGALRRRHRGFAPRSRLPTALWGIQEGKADVTRGKTGAPPDEQRGHAGLVPADPVT